jgi:mRNA interferase HigB
MGIERTLYLAVSRPTFNSYEDQTVYYKHFLTHAEYDKGKWKNDPYF